MSEQLEVRLRAVIATVTGCDVAGLDPDCELIAELGLDSLTGLRVLARIEQHFGVRFQDQKLDQLRTLRALETAVRAARGAGLPGESEAQA